MQSLNRLMLLYGVRKLDLDILTADRLLLG